VRTWDLASNARAPRLKVVSGIARRYQDGVRTRGCRASSLYPVGVRCTALPPWRRQELDAGELGHPLDVIERRMRSPDGMS
jgi:hypothetical protein